MTPPKYKIFLKICIMFSLLYILGGVTSANSDLKADLSNNIRITFEHVYAGVDRQYFDVYVTNYNAETTNIGLLDTLLAEHNLDNYNIKVFKYVYQERYDEMAEYCKKEVTFKDCQADNITKEEVCKDKTGYDIVECGKYTINNSYFELKPLESLIWLKFLETGKYRIELYYPSKIEAEGLLSINSNGFDYWDKTHSSFFNNSWQQKYNITINTGWGTIINLNISATTCMNNLNETRLTYLNKEYPFEWYQGTNNITMDSITFIYNISGQTTGNYTLYCNASGLVAGTWGNKTVFIQTDNFNDGTLNKNFWVLDNYSTGYFNESLGLLNGKGDTAQHNTYLNGTKALSRGVTGLYVSIERNGSLTGGIGDYFGIGTDSYLHTCGAMRMIYFNIWDTGTDQFTINTDNYTYCGGGLVGDSWGGSSSVYSFGICPVATFGLFLNGTDLGTLGGGYARVNDTCGSYQAGNNLPVAIGGTMSNGQYNNLYIKFAPKSLVSSWDNVYASNYPFNITLPRNVFTASLSGVLIPEVEPNITPTTAFFNYTANLTEDWFSPKVETTSIQGVMLIFLLILIYVGMIIYHEYSRIMIFGMLVAMIGFYLAFFIWTKISWIFGAGFLFFNLFYLIRSLKY